MRPSHRMSRRKGLNLFVCSTLLLSLALGGCKSGGETSHPALASRSVILISIDTLRADFVGAYGNSQRLTPFLDAFSNEGILFENCYSQSAKTLPSHASLMTARYYNCHQASQDPERSFWLSKEELTLAEVLSANGFRTGASTDGGFISARFGFHQGFEVYFEPDIRQLQPDGTNPTTGIEAVNRRALQWLDGVPSEQPFFLFLHYYDVHNFIRDITGGLATKRALMHGSLEPSPELVAAMREAYATRLRYLDGQLRQLFTQLEQRGRRKSTFVFISSDHGEGFGEHGWFGHGSHLHQEAIWVPLLVQGPDLPQGVRIAEPVQNLDIFPTTLDLLGLAPPEGLQGASLTPLIFGWDAAPRMAVSEVDEPGQAKCLVSASVKLFWHPGDQPRLQLVDLATDPDERGNLAPQQETLAFELRQRLLDLIDCQGRRVALESAQRQPLSAEERASLEAIGYLQQ